MPVPMIMTVAVLMVVIMAVTVVVVVVMAMTVMVMMIVAVGLELSMVMVHVHLPCRKPSSEIRHKVILGFPAVVQGLRDTRDEGVDDMILVPQVVCGEECNVRIFCGHLVDVSLDAANQPARKQEVRRNHDLFETQFYGHFQTPTH